MRRYSNEVTTLSFNDIINNDKNNDKNKYNRLESNIYLNKRESYDDSNKLINSLNEEILSLKRKMKFVFEKDKEIEKLKIKINELERENANSDSKYKNENTALKITNASLEEKNKQYLDQISELLSHENKEIELLDSLKKENSLLKRELNIIKKNNNKVKVDINKLKEVLNQKLKNKRDDKVEQLLKEYNITDQKLIDKNIIQKLIKDII